MGRKKLARSDRELQEGRNWTCEIYPESTDIEIFINRLNSFWGYDPERGLENSFYYILHDQDIYTEMDFDKYIIKNNKEPEWKIGDKKKPHYHIIACSKTPIILATAAKKFGIETNYVEKVSKLKSMVRYLIHADNPEKHQYGIEEIITNNSSSLSKFFNAVEDGLSVTEKARIIIEFLECNANLNLTQISSRLLDLGVWDEFRRGQHLYIQMIKEIREGRKF